MPALQRISNSSDKSAEELREIARNALHDADEQLKLNLLI
jgi:hypothetical protein